MTDIMDKTMKFIERWIMVAAVVIFIAHYTILKTYYDSTIGAMKTYVLLAIGLLFVVNFIRAPRQEKIDWIRRKNIFVPSMVLIVLYFIARAVTIVLCDFDYSVIKTVVYEGIFLVAISRWTATDNMKFSDIAICIMVLITVINILNLLSFHYFMANAVSDYSGNSLMTYMAGFTPEINRGIMYTNPNRGGILSGLALVLSLWFVRKNKKKWLILLIPFWILNLYSMYILDCRNSNVAIFVALVSMVLLFAVKRLKPHVLVTICLICCVCVTAGIYGLIQYNLQDGDTTLSVTESQINAMTTGRYQIWQDAVASHADQWAFGAGSYEREIDERNAYLEERFVAAGGSEGQFVPTTLHLHNGYLSVMIYGGIFATALFIFIIVDKLFGAKSLRYGEDIYKFERIEAIVIAGMIIYFLMINLAEPHFIGKRHLDFLLIMVAMAWNKYKTEEGIDDTDGKLSHKTE